MSISNVSLVGVEFVYPDPVSSFDSPIYTFEVYDTVMLTIANGNDTISLGGAFLVEFNCNIPSRQDPISISDPISFSYPEPGLVHIPSSDVLNCTICSNLICQFRLPTVYTSNGSIASSGFFNYVNSSRDSETTWGPKPTVTPSATSFLGAPTPTGILTSLATNGHTILYASSSPTSIATSTGTSTTALNPSSATTISSTPQAGPLSTVSSALIGVGSVLGLSFIALLVYLFSIWMQLRENGEAPVQGRRWIRHLSSDGPLGDEFENDNMFTGPEMTPPRKGSLLRYELDPKTYCIR